jgi:hypothetical protein
MPAVLPVLQPTKFDLVVGRGRNPAEISALSLHRRLPVI